MKIIHVLNFYLPAHVAGTEVYSYALIDNLRKYGLEFKVIIPNYGKERNETYEYDDIEIIKYAEPSKVNRSLILGKRKPDGLKNFLEIINREQPKVVHFHEVAGSNGITIHHLHAIKSMGIKIMMTMHLANYSCKTSTLKYKNSVPCDGKINITKCTYCYLLGKSNAILAPLITGLSILVHKFGIKQGSLPGKWGTALTTCGSIHQLQQHLIEINNICDVIIVPSIWYKKILIDNGINKKKLSFIPQALPFHPQKFQESKNRNIEFPIRLIFLGRISKFKGLHLLLEAIRSFDEDVIMLDIYGETSELAYDKECRMISKDNNNIHWKGKLNPGKVVEAISNYDFLCLCSTFSEMSPLVIQEAFAAHVPVIASDVYGNKEQIIHGVNGLLFEFNNVKSLRQQIQKIINDPTLIHQLKLNIKTPISFQEIGEEYLSLYKHIGTVK